ncbi:hypothetical protein SALBM217S_00812 [Streptomyces griseoloalbus]
MDSATSELPTHRTPLRDTAETGLKIVVVGGFGVGKTTLAPRAARRGGTRPGRGRRVRR